jgi:hypothetical protein
MIFDQTSPHYSKYLYALISRPFSMKIAPMQSPSVAAGAQSRCGMEPAPVERGWRSPAR